MYVCMSVYGVLHVCQIECMHTQSYILGYTHTGIHAAADTQAFIHAWIRTCNNTGTLAGIRVHTYMPGHTILAYTHIYMHAYNLPYIHTYIYIYTNAHTQ